MKYVKNVREEIWGKIVDQSREQSVLQVSCDIFSKAGNEIWTPILNKVEFFVGGVVRNRVRMELNDGKRKLQS